MEVSKKEVAILQLCDAINLFKRERYISSITLAGASEEVLAQLLSRQKRKTVFRYYTAEELEAGTFDMFEHFFGVKNYYSYRNKIKNELKHHGDKKNKEVLSGDFRQVALNHISAAVQNYKMMNGQLPNEEIITEFCNEIGIS